MGKLRNYLLDTKPKKNKNIDRSIIDKIKKLNPFEKYQLMSNYLKILFHPSVSDLKKEQDNGLNIVLQYLKDSNKSKEEILKELKKFNKE